MENVDASVSEDEGPIKKKQRKQPAKQKKPKTPVPDDDHDDDEDAAESATLDLHKLLLDARKGVKDEAAPDS